MTQPIGEFYIGAIQSKDLCEITKYDFRRLQEESGSEFATYLGINREVNERRRKEIAKYVGTADACFPTAIILAVPGVCAEFNETEGTMTLRPHVDAEAPDDNVGYHEIAVVLDGQHRIAGLKDGDFEPPFDINVSVFIDMDISDQAYLFSTVNLAQTKVNRSLVFDLYDLAKSRSPQKMCHNIAVALDRANGSPFLKRIKRLGTATPGRTGETITQATFVQALLGHVSKDPVADRDLYLKGSKPKLATAEELRIVAFRNMFIEEKDLDITDVIWNFFEAVRSRWENAWDSGGQGVILNKTNGFRALMRFLRPCYLALTNPGGIPKTDEFLEVFSRIPLDDEHFKIDNYPPGTSGESKLFRELLEQSKITL
jgi:DGQHR domain-containing protein